jgi:hypothetical protein
VCDVGAGDSTLAHAPTPFLGCLSEILQGLGYGPEVAHYLFNFVNGDSAKEPALREQATGLLRVRMWGIDEDERHRNALAAGDLILIYLGAPAREFIGRAELASAVHDWTPSEAQVYPGDSPSGVLLAEVEHWDPPVPMNTVLSQIDPGENAKADFEAGVVRITAHEYETALAVAAGRAASTGQSARRASRLDPFQS